MSQSHGGLGRLWKWSYLRAAQRFEPASNNQVCWHHIWKAAWGDESSRDGFFSFILLPRFSFLVICCAGLVVVIARLCVQSCWPIRKGRSIIKHCFYADCHLELKTVAVLMFEKLRWKLVIVIVMSATAIGIVYIISSHWSTAVEQFVLICFSSQIDSSFVSFDWISQTSSFDRSDDGYCLSRGRNHFFLLQFISWKNETWKCLFSSFWTGTSQIRHARPCETGFGEKKKNPSMHLAEMFISWFLIEPWKAKSCFWLTPISTVRGRAVKREHILYCV